VAGQLHRQPSPQPLDRQMMRRCACARRGRSRAPAPPAAEGWITCRRPGPPPCSCWVAISRAIPMLGTVASWRLGEPFDDIPGAARSPAPARLPAASFALTVNGDSMIAATSDELAMLVFDGAVNEPAGFQRPARSWPPWWRRGHHAQAFPPARGGLVGLESRQPPPMRRC